MNNHIECVLQKYTGLNDITFKELNDISEPSSVIMANRKLLWLISSSSEGVGLFTNSFSYARLLNPTGSLFMLCEVELGYTFITETKQNTPPIGYNSILCPGRSTPDPDQDETITIQEKTVNVPVGDMIRRACECFYEYDTYKCKEYTPRFVLKVNN